MKESQFSSLLFSPPSPHTFPTPSLKSRGQSHFTHSKGKCTTTLFEIPCEIRNAQGCLKSQSLRWRLGIEQASASPTFAESRPTVAWPPPASQLPAGQTRSHPQGLRCTRTFTVPESNSPSMQVNNLNVFIIKTIYVFIIPPQQGGTRFCCLPSSPQASPHIQLSRLLLSSLRVFWPPCQSYVPNCQHCYWVRPSAAHSPLPFLCCMEDPELDHPFQRCHWHHPGA